MEKYGNVQLQVARGVDRRFVRGALLRDAAIERSLVLQWVFAAGIILSLIANFSYFLVPRVTTHLLDCLEAPNCHCVQRTEIV